MRYYCVNLYFQIKNIFVWRKTRVNLFIVKMLFILFKFSVSNLYNFSFNFSSADFNIFFVMVNIHTSQFCVTLIFLNNLMVFTTGVWLPKKSVSATLFHSVKIIERETIPWITATRVWFWLGTNLFDTT